MSQPGADDRAPDPDPAGSPTPIELSPSAIVIASPAAMMSNQALAVKNEPSVHADPRPETPPEISADRWAHRRAEPRPLALLWTIFLALSTMICLASLAARGATSYESYRPAARSLLTIVAIGLTVLWPMVRLSQSPARGSIAAWVWKDLVVLLLPAQAVIWPQAFFFLAKWPTDVVGCVSMMLSSWTILTGALLAWASTLIRRDEFARTRRASLMLILLTPVAAGPLISLPFRVASGTATAHTADFDGWSMTSPITAVFELTRDRLWTGQPARIIGPHWWGVAIVAAGAVVAWIGLTLWSQGRAEHPAAPSPAGDDRGEPPTNI